MASQYVGVRAERNQWRADIQIDGKKKFLGYFKSELAAANAYNNALNLHGLNRPVNDLNKGLTIPPLKPTIEVILCLPSGERKLIMKI